MSTPYLLVSIFPKVISVFPNQVDGLFIQNISYPFTLLTIIWVPIFIVLQ